MSLKKILVGAVAAVATLTVVGCGSAADITGSQSAAMSKSDFAGALTKATSQAKSVHVAGTVTAQGQAVQLTADAASSDSTLAGAAAQITVALPGMGTFEARILDGVAYLKGGELLGQPSSKPWVKIDLNDPSNPIGSMLTQVTDTVGPGQFGDLVKGLSQVTKVGPETVDGVATTHYTVTLNTAKLGSSLGDSLGLTPSQLGSTQLPRSIGYDVWLDRDSQPVRLTLGSAGFDLDLHFSKWGQPVHVTAPPASQVGSASF